MALYNKNMQSLPAELQRMIFSWLPAKDVLQMSLVNNQMHSIIHDEVGQSQIWMPLYAHEFEISSAEVALRDVNNWKTEYFESIAAPRWNREDATLDVEWVVSPDGRTLTRQPSDGNQKWGCIRAHRPCSYGRYFEGESNKSLNRSNPYVQYK